MDGLLRSVCDKKPYTLSFGIFQYQVIIEPLWELIYKKHVPLTLYWRLADLMLRIDTEALEVCEALVFFLGNIYIRFGSKLYRQIVGIPMGTNCAPLVADLFLFCYERDFMLSFSEDYQSGVIEAYLKVTRAVGD